MRLLVLCTHNSTRSQMAEGWLRHYAGELGLEAEVCSAGTEKTSVKPGALNEGQGINPGDTSRLNPGVSVTVTAQRRPGHQPRRHR